MSPINVSFEQNFVLGSQAQDLVSLLVQIRDYHRATAPSLYHKWVTNFSDGNPFETPKEVWLEYNQLGQFRMSEHFWVFERYFGVGFSLLGPGSVFSDTALGQLGFYREDVPVFPAISQVLLDTAEAWTGYAARSAVELGVASEDYWYLHLQIAPNSQGQWPDGYDIWVNQPFADPADEGIFSVEADASEFTASFKDAEGKRGRVLFRAAGEEAAKQYANAIAAASDAQWTELKRLSNLNLGPVYVNGVQAGDNYRLLPDPASSVHRKGRMTYRTSSPENHIGLEIPSVRPEYLAKGTRTTQADPLAGAGTGKLRSEAGAAAVALKGGHYFERKAR